VTGDAPQPGETPRNQSDPWLYPDPNTAWWRVEQERDEIESLADAVAARPRHPRRRPASTTPANAADPPPAYGGPEPAVEATPAFAPEAFDAHAAGVRDAARELDPPPAALVEAELATKIENIETAAAAETVADPTTVPELLEREDEHRTADRDHQTDEGYDVRPAEETPDPESVEDQAAELPDLAHRPEGVPDVMVLPEPSPNRPTVALTRGPVPGQPPARLGGVSRERMENSPFWLADEERSAAGAAAGPAPEIRRRRAEASAPGDTRSDRPPAVRPRSPRHPLPGMLALVALALVAAFFSWVSAEPFWLAAGHGDRGVATIARCTGSGVTQRCTGSFASAGGRFTVAQVALLGVGPDARNPGTKAPARMVSPASRQAYVGDTGWMVHLRWVLGFILVVMCGYGIAGLTGARQLETASARRGAVLISLAGPVLLLIGFLVAAL